jgi:amino acid transporter
VIEICGLAAIIIAGLWRDPAILTLAPQAVSGLGSAAAWPGILGASMLAFFAFIGFEAMVNVAEEVEEPKRTLPIAIAITLIVSTALYILVVWVAIQSVPRAELAASTAPLSLVFERLTGASPALISLIAIFATVNGVIVQNLLASRVIYGMARQGTLPAVLGEVNATTHTPLVATALAVGLTLIAALALPIDKLADLTTQAMLIVFATVNAALWMLKRRGDTAHAGVTVPAMVPIAGTVSCLALLVADLLS